ncbi:MAG TPA: peptidoglycan-binding protein [Solirubrobacteraceae bacterium]|nr:peptidoglycan-binding protein [Solirubrobacteraceae bacterium]
MSATDMLPTATAVAGEDGWAIFAQPPGVRDLGLRDYWNASLERSLRRRAARRRPKVVAKGHARVSLALAAAAIGTPVATGAVAAQQAAASTTTSLGLGMGSRGATVRALQRALGIAADGIFGAQTQSAVRAFQRAHGIPATGYVGSLTTAALGTLSSSASTTQASPRASADAAPGLSIATIEAAQRALGVGADGIVGPVTRHAIRSFQSAHGLTVDGVLGTATLAALGVSATPADPAGADTQASTTTTAAPAAASGVQAAVSAAMSRVGDPYRAGGTSPGGFDCSGLVYWAMHQAGISVPRTSFSQYGAGAPVPSSQIQAGDLVFFDTAGPGASDVGIATGPTTAVSATTHGVMTHSILSGYWGSHYVGARRIT